MTEELPDGWAWVALGDVVDSIKNGVFVSRAKSEPDGVPILRIGAVRPMSLDLGDLRYSRMSEECLRDKDALLVEGDILFTRYNGNPDLVGACALVSTSVALTYPDKLIRARVSKEVALSSYVALVFSSQDVRSQVRLSVRSTAGQAGISGSDLRSVRVPLPPLGEQRRIVAALEAELSRLDAADKQLAQAEARLTSLRARFVEDTCLGRGRKGAESSAQLAPAAVDDGMVPGLPAGWEWKRLQEVADVVGGVTKDARKQSDPDCAEVPYLRVANVQKGALDLTQVKTIRVPPKKASQLELLPGDVLLNEGGDRDKLGRGWVWEGQIPGCIHQNHVFRARVRDGAIHPKLLSWHANEFGQRWCQANGKQSVNLASISLSKIRLLPIPVPPEEEQAELVKKLETAMSVFDRTAEQLASARAKATALRQALLNTAFTGKLVPQDPADEPASALLERLKAEHATVPATKRGRRSATAKATSAPARTSSATLTRIADDPQPVHAGEQTTLEF